MINENQLDLAIEKNNAVLLETKQMIPYEVKDDKGVVLYIVNYFAEEWFIIKAKGKNSPYYRLEKKLTTKKGRSVSIRTSLTDDQVQYLNYMKDNLLSYMQPDSMKSMAVKTRFFYGMHENGSYYIGVKMFISDRFPVSFFLDPLIVDIVVDAMSDVSTAFNIIFDKSKKMDEVPVEEMTFL